MKKTIIIQNSSLRISSRRMIFVFVILLFVSQSILHAEIQNGSFEFDGHLRNYMVYLPTNYTGSTNFPLVICLHPYDRTAEWMMIYTNFNQVADAYDFIVVYPSGIPNWNSGIGDLPGYTTPNVDDVGFINALIDIMINSYGINPERIYACGYSNGGCMSYKLACQLSNRIAAIASVGSAFSPSTAESCSPLYTIPVLNIYGTADPYVTINVVDETLSYWINFNDCVQIDTATLPDLDPTDGCTVEKITYTDCSDNSNVVYYKVINGGHTWPGADPIPAFGNTNQDIDASVEIWNFFKDYKLVIPSLIDFNGNGICDINDLVVMIENWETSESRCDIGPMPRGDGIVDKKDLEVFMSYWGQVIDVAAYYKLDETEGTIVYDSINNIKAQLYGDPVWRPTDGMVNGALMLDGIDDFVGTWDIPGLSDGDFSVFLWIKGGNPGQVVVSEYQGVNWLMADETQGYLKTDLTCTMGRSAGQSLVSEVTITDGQWHRIGLTWDGTNRVLYVDDVVAASDTQASLERSGMGLNIGCGPDETSGTFFSGLIDDVRIYNRAITP